MIVTNSYTVLFVDTDIDTAAVVVTAIIEQQWILPRKEAS